MKINMLLFYKTILQFYKKTRRGFSLIEVMTSVVIISALTSISYISWNQYVKKIRKAEVKLSLSIVHAAMERFSANKKEYYPGFKAVGIEPAGKLHYNVGGTFDALAWKDGDTNALPPLNRDHRDYGNADCSGAGNGSGCINYFGGGGTDPGLCGTETDFKNFSGNKKCFIKEQYYVSNQKMNNYISGTDADGDPILSNCPTSNNAIEPKKYCIFAISNAKRASSPGNSDYDVWAVNHHGAIKHIQNR